MRWPIFIILAVIFGAGVSGAMDWHQVPRTPGEDTALAIVLLIAVSGCILVLQAVLGEILSWLGW